MERKLFQRVFVGDDHALHWQCPRCGIGALQLVSESLIEQQTARSAFEQKVNGNDPTIYDGVYVCLVQCKNGNCGELMSVAGTTGYEERYDDPEIDGAHWAMYYRPTRMDPPPHIIRYFEKCPELVKDEIDRAERLYWVDEKAAVNAIGTALEILFTGLRVPRFRRTNHGRRRLSLAERIAILAARNPRWEPPATAIRWIRNEGSHSGNVTSDDVLDALELLEFLLEEIVDRRPKKLARLAGEIARIKGPRSRRAVARN